MLWLSAIVFIGLWWVINRETKGGGGGKGHAGGAGGRGGAGFKATALRLINFAFFVVGMLSLWLAPLGSWGNIASLLSWVLGRVLGWLATHAFTGLSGTGLAFGLAIVLTVAIVLDLIGRKPDKVARVGLLVLVPLCLVAGGSFGQAVIDLTTSLTSTPAEVLQEWSSS